MEISCSKDLLNCISWFCSLPSESSVESKLVQRYGQDLREIFKLSKPAVEDILSPDIALDESLMSKLQELSILADEARILIEGWQEMMSKVYFVLRIESAISNIKALLQDIFSSLSHMLVQNTCTDFVEKMQHVTCQSISDIIKDAIQELIENMIPRSELTEKIAELLTLSSNEELLMEIVALDNLKTNISCGENHGEMKYIECIIALVNYMHDCYVDKYQLHSINNKPIPSDFCCPLSLELMVDPVIVASGQTYERASIKKWLEQGFMVCPKTRQILSHTNLIPNYTVKALIANWCETYNIKRPNSAKSPHLIMKDFGTSNAGTSAKPGESNAILKNSNKDLLPLNEHPLEAHLSEAISSTLVVNESGTNVDRPSVTSTYSDASNSEKHHVDYGLGATTGSTNHYLKVDDEYPGHDQSVSAPRAVESANHLLIGDADVVTRVPSDLTQYNTDVSGELTQEAHPFSSQREPEFTLRSVDVISTGNNLRRHPSDRFGLRIISSSMDTRHDLSGLETQVRKLVEELKSDSIDVQRAATIELRQLAKHSTENRIVIANCEAIPQLVRLLPSEDPKTQENAVTTLLNLSINDNNKMTIANADAIDPLVHVLETGTVEAKENSAATLFSLSVIEENKAKIGRSGAIIPLVELLGSGTPRGKKDAATALFNLSILHENKARIVQAGAVRHLVELMDPAAGMVDKAVAVLANLTTIPEGRSAIGHEGGIPYLVEVVELGSARGKENAAAALVQLCTTNSRFSSMVLQEGAVPPLVALSQSGTARAKEKAQVLLAHFRGQRHGNPGRA